MCQRCQNSEGFGALYGKEKFRVSLLDYGAKNNIIRSLQDRGCAVTAWPLSLLLRGVDTLTAWVGRLPYAVVDDINLSSPLLVALTVVVVVMLLMPQVLLRRRD